MSKMCVGSVRSLNDQYKMRVFVKVQSKRLSSDIPHSSYINAHSSYVTESIPMKLGDCVCILLRQNVAWWMICIYGFKRIEAA